MANQNINISKISPPTTRKMLYRKRLFKLLDDSFQYPVTWISAPAGFGKTTLTTSYLEERKRPCLWYQVDERDTDPAAFFYYMGKALNQIGPKNNPPPLLLTQEYLSSLETFSKIFFENLFGRLSPSSIVVLDDFQFLPDGSDAQNLIIEGLRQIPSGVHVFIVSRKAPCPAMAVFLARQEMTFFGKEEMTLTREEAGDIIKLHDIAGLQANTVSKLHEITKGWAAGMVLIMQQLKLEGADLSDVADCPLEEIFNYLALEIFQKLDPRVKHLLQGTAFLKAFTPEMAEALTGAAHAGDILAELYKENCFTCRRYQSGWVYQYHPLFNKFLRHQVYTTLTPSQIDDLKIQTASVLINTGQIEDAAVLYCQTAAWDHLRRLVQMSAKKLLTQGRRQILIEWINALPPEFLASDPWLMYLMGVCGLPFDPVKARKWFKRAYNRFMAEQNSEGVYLSWSHLVETHIHMRGSLIPLDDLITAADAIVTQFPGFPSRETEYRFVLGMTSALVFRQPMHPRFSKWEKEANRLLHGSVDISQKVMLANFLVLHYCKMAELSKAAVIVTTIEPLLNASDISPLTQIVWRSILSLYLWVTGDFKASLKAIKAGIEISKDSGVHIWDTVLFGFGACVTLSSGDSKGTNHYLENMAKTILSVKIFDAATYHYLAAWNALQRNDFSFALEHAEIALAMSKEAGDFFYVGRCHLGLAQIHLEKNQPFLASVHLNHAQKTALKINNDVLRCRYFTIQACYFLSSGDNENGLLCLKKALTIAKDKQMLLLDWIRPETIGRLFVRALEEGIEIEYVRKLIRKLNLAPDPPPVTCELWPWPLRIFTLGRFSVVTGGKRPAFQMKGKAKPLEMLKVVIALGGREVGKNQVEDILWPDADGDTANQSFTITLHRLRQLLGIKEAILLRESKLSLNHNFCWVDAWAFERLLTQAETERSNGDIDDSMRFEQKAIDLYKGAFLANDGQFFWSYTLRERLKSKYCRCIEHMGARFRSMGNIGKAIDCYRKALEVDAMAEPVYKQLMLSLKQTGHTADAVAVYHKCKKALTTVPDIAPSGETNAIYKSLMSR